MNLMRLAIPAAMAAIATLTTLSSARADAVTAGSVCQPADRTTAIAYTRAGEVINTYSQGERTVVCPIDHRNRNDNHFRARVDVYDGNDGRAVSCTAVAKDINSAWVYGQSTQTSGAGFTGNKSLVMDRLYAVGSDSSTAIYFVECTLPRLDGVWVGGIFVPFDLNEASAITGILTWEIEPAAPIPGAG